MPLASLLLLAAPAPALAFQCLVISGLKQDHNGALKDHVDLLTGKRKIAGHPCRAFGSWKDLETYVQEKAKDGERLFILQAAHGGEGGKAFCDKSNTSGDEILGALERMSERHPITTALKSCYSGDILRLKLIKDSIKPDHPSVSKLCLITSSPFGRLGWSGSRDFLNVSYGISTSDTAEDFFQRTHGGLISSASWENSGITEYFFNYDVESAMKALSSIQQKADSCPGPAYRASAKLCGEQISAKAFEEFLNIQLEEQKLPLFNNPIEIARKGMRKRLKEMEDFDRHWWSVELKDVVNWSLDCDRTRCHRRFKKILDVLIADHKFVNYGRVSIPSDVFFEKFAEFKKTGGYQTDCPREGIAELQDLLPPSTMKYETRERLRWTEEAYRRLRKKDDQEIDDYRQSIPSRKNQPDQERKKILNAVLGQSTWSIMERDNYACNGMDSIWASPSQALLGFVWGSLDEKEFKNPIDRKRREACRKFKFSD